MTLPYHVDRVIDIRAGRDTVFRFFTDTARWAAWWAPVRRSTHGLVDDS